MKSAREIREQYQMANTLAVKSQKKNDKQVLPVCPASQNDLVDDRLVQENSMLQIDTHVFSLTGQKTCVFLYSIEYRFDLKL